MSFETRSDAKIGVTALIPCLDEEQTIEHVYESINRYLGPKYDTEILFVDDGSSDRTLPRIKHLADADSRVKYISFSRNFGLEAAFTAGYKYASRDWIVQLDADLQSSAGDAISLVEKAQEGYDVVYAIRRHRKDPLYRRLGSKYQQAIAPILGIKLVAGASVFRVVRSTVARRIVTLKQQTPYFIATAYLVGARCTSVFVEHHPRKSGSSKWSLTQLVSHTLDLFTGFSHRLLHVVHILTVAVWLLAILMLIMPSQFTLPMLALALAIVQLSLTLLSLQNRQLIKASRGLPMFLIRESNIAICPVDSLYSTT